MRPYVLVYTHIPKLLTTLLFDSAGMLRPLGELDSVLKQARASAATRTTLFRIARKLWQADGVPQLDALRFQEFIDTSDAEEES